VKTHLVNKTALLHASIVDILVLFLQEAKQILNLDNGVEIEKIEKNFQHLFEINDKKKGGSFYLQSKVSVK